MIFPLNLIFAKDWNGRFVLANQATAEIYGTTVEDLIGTTDADFNPNAAEVEQFLQSDRDVISTQQLKLIEEFVTSATGKARWFQTIKKPIASIDGQSTLVLGVATDITGDAAEAANRAKSEFLEAMSHELRTPLNAILGIAQTFQHDSSFSSDHQESLKIVHRNENHLLSLINDLLEIAKIGVNQSPSVSNRFDRGLTLKPDPDPQIGDEIVDQKLIVYLAQMPPEWVAQLYQAAIKGFDQGILQLVTQIPADCVPLTTSLTAWVKDFRFDKVTDLIQQMGGNYSLK